MSDSGIASFRTMLGEVVAWKALIVGANPVDGPPVFAVPLAEGHVEVVGFEPNPVALDELNAAKGPHETYLPHAIGDGAPHALHIFAAAGMNSLLPANADVLNLFHGFPTWAQLVAKSPMPTVRLDDVAQAAGADMIQIDIQGAELMALQHGTRCLRDAVVVQCEVEFVALYAGQPLFAEVDQFFRGQGFMLHRFWQPLTRAVQPLVHDPTLGGFGQLVSADAVFIRDLTRLDLLGDRQLLVMAAILHDCYGSADVALHALSRLDRRDGGRRATVYFDRLRGMPIAA